MDSITECITGCITGWLKELIEFNTTMDEGNTDDCAAFIDGVFKENGVSSVIIRPKGCGSMVFAEVRGRRREALLLHAHLDTAPYYRELNWRFPPDRATFIKNKICGRGAVDCKGQAAVWMKLMCDAAKAAGSMEYSLRAVFTCDEENGGEKGLKRLMEENRSLFDDVFLVIGEGGGFSFPYGGRICYTFQTGEREDMEGGPWERQDRRDDETEDKIEDKVDDNKEADIEKVISLGIKKGYYSPMLLDYIKNSEKEIKRLDTYPLYAGMEEYLTNAPYSEVYGRFGQLFEEALKASAPEAVLMPVITPGYSDNRYFRRAGMPVIGFFPFDVRDHIWMHTANEYISLDTLKLAYEVMGRVVERICMGY